MTILAKLDAPPDAVQTAVDYQTYAQQRLEPAIWDYLQSGAGSGVTLLKNSAAFNQVPLMPRPLANVAGGDTQLHLFGQTFAHPIVLAPIAYQGLFHTDAERGSAMAAVAQGGQMLVSSLASQTVEAIINAAEKPLWFQLYWQGNRERTLTLVKRVINAGYSAIFFTVDAPVKQASMVLPPHIAAVNLAPALPFNLAANASVVFDGWMRQAPTWDDVQWLRQQISIPLIIKGILHADDALHAMRLGCDGIVVSNHGGRVLDGVPASLTMLPEIAQLTAGKIKVFFDSGITNGQDVYKALHLGADAVLLGRPYVWGLATLGAIGVAHVIKLTRDELEMTMALCGAAQLAHIRVNNRLSDR